MSHLDFTLKYNKYCKTGNVKDICFLINNKEQAKNWLVGKGLRKTNILMLEYNKIKTNDSVIVY